MINSIAALSKQRPHIKGTQKQISRVSMEIMVSQQTQSITWNRRFKAFVQRISQVRGLNVFYATLCIIDLFGVFPIVALPGALISCGKYFLCKLKPFENVFFCSFE